MQPLRDSKIIQNSEYLNYSINCKFCTSLQLSLVIAGCRMVAPNSRLLNLLTASLAAAALTSLIAEREERSLLIHTDDDRALDLLSFNNDTVETE